MVQGTRRRIRLHAAARFGLVAMGLACSQRVTPEDEFAEAARERPLVRVAEPAAPVADDPAAIRGTIVWPAGPDTPVASTDVLFLVVRPAGQAAQAAQAGGPPLAVQRLPAGGFPLAFAIGPRDAMMADAAFPPSVTVAARLDRDGDPLTSGPGDWSAISPPVAPGATGVDLTLAPE